MLALLDLLVVERLLVLLQRKVIDVAVRALPKTLQQLFLDRFIQARCRQRLGLTTLLPPVLQRCTHERVWVSKPKPCHPTPNPPSRHPPQNWRIAVSHSHLITTKTINCVVIRRDVRAPCGCLYNGLPVTGGNADVGCPTWPCTACMESGRTKPCVRDCGFKRPSLDGSTWRQRARA